MLKTVTNSINASQIQTPITLPGDVTLSTGNLVIGTSGKGIDFSATSGTGTSELLSDYEEGTWTPTITLGGGSTGIAYSAQTGKYTKIGRQVTVAFNVILSNKGSDTGGLRINSLPFAQTGERPSGIIGYITGTVPYSVETNFYVDGTEIVFNPGGAGGLTDVQLANNSQFFGSATYFV